MSLHQTIKNQIIEALRAKDTIKLDTLRGLSSLFTNEVISNPSSATPDGMLKDESALALIKRSVKQRKDSIEQFEKGGRADLAQKEKAELAILEGYLPQMLSKDEIRPLVQMKIDEAKARGEFNEKSAGKFVGIIMRELSGKAEGNDVKAVVEEVIKATA